MKNKNNKFTPGPWTEGPDPLILIGGKDTHHQEVVAEAYTQADKKLIAAAPDLLAALEGLINVVEAEPEACGIYKAHAEKARAAIAKAKGE